MRAYPVRARGVVVLSVASVGFVWAGLQRVERTKQAAESGVMSVVMWGYWGIFQPKVALATGFLTRWTHVFSFV
jgi:hypothetical protein